MRKFIGGCLDGITLLNGNLETVVGALSEVQQSMAAVVEREKEAETEQRQILELQQMIKVARKEITTWHTRAQTEPGFMVPPPEEEKKNPALEKFLAEKAAQEELEAKMAVGVAGQDE